jgi:hypothetical protein
MPDNGGIVFFGPLGPPGSKTTMNLRDHRMYISPTMDATEVGQALLAMLADFQLSEKPITPSSVDLDKDLGDITF